MTRHSGLGARPPSAAALSRRARPLRLRAPPSNDLLWASPLRHCPAITRKEMLRPRRRRLTVSAAGGMVSSKVMRRLPDLPLRRKLILSFLAVSIVGGVISLIFGTRLQHQTIFSLAQAKVRHDLASAWMVYHEKSNSVRDIVRLSAAREFVRDVLLSGNAAGAAGKLDDLRRDYSAGHPHFDRRAGTGRPQGPPSRSPGRRPVRRSRSSGAPCSNSRRAGPRSSLERNWKRRAPTSSSGPISNSSRTPMAAERPDDHEENGMMLRGRRARHG